MATNPAEALVQRLCDRTFLSMWSVPNPLLRPGKELCDAIVACDPDVILWSVKEISLKDPDSPVDAERWRRRAIEESLKQLDGAARALDRLSEVRTPGRRHGLVLPAAAGRRVHRVAVALGSKGNAILYEPDRGSAHVHVMDEVALECLLTELDTVSDFVEYLRAKEAFLSKAQVLQGGRENDLLGLYLHRGREFPAEADLLVVEPGIWEEVTGKPEWVRRKAADKVSYAWDRIIESFAQDALTDDAKRAEDLLMVERTIRTMARETRFARRMLGESFLEFMRSASEGKTRARMNQSPSGITYVFLAQERAVKREHRQAELAARCFVARGSIPNSRVVVGIATERYIGKPGFSFDAVYLDKTEWTAEDEEEKSQLQRDLGYFSTPSFTRAAYSEYPGTVPKDA